MLCFKANKTKSQSPTSVEDEPDSCLSSFMALALLAVQQLSQRPAVGDYGLLNE